MADNGRKKTTTEQRLRMLQFMEEHPDFAQNRLQGIDSKKRTAVLWERLASELNSCGNGATKSTDKWIKSWRDWRVDTKSKAAKLKNYQRGTGGGGPSATALNELEERLITLIGIESIHGHSKVIDPAEPLHWTEKEHVTLKENLPPCESPTSVPFTSVQTCTDSSIHLPQKDTLFLQEASQAVPSTSISSHEHTSIRIFPQKNTQLQSQTPLAVSSIQSTNNVQSSIYFPQEKTMLQGQPSSAIPSPPLSNHSNLSIHIKKPEATFMSSSSSLRCPAVPEQSQKKVKCLKTEKLAEVPGKRLIAATRGSVTDIMRIIHFNNFY